MYDAASIARLHQTRTGFLTPAYASIEAKRNLVTTPAECRGVINYLTTDGQLKLTAVSRPSMMPAVCQRSGSRLLPVARDMPAKKIKNNQLSCTKKRYLKQCV